MTVPITVVLFDLDGTLLDRRATFRYHLEQQVGRHPELFGARDAAGYVSEALALDENGTLDREQFYSRVEARLALTAGAAALLRADFKAHFPELCSPFRDVVTTLAALKSKDLRVGVVTNGSVRTQTRRTTMRPARHMSTYPGEIYDFEFTPEAAGDLVLEFDHIGLTPRRVPVHVR